MNLVIIGHSFVYETENLLRLFFPGEKTEVTDERNDDERFVLTKLISKDEEAHIEVKVNIGDKKEKRECDVFFREKREDDTKESFLERRLEVFLYELLCDITSYTPPWGILTGVRPAKLMTNLSLKYGEKAAAEYFTNELRVSEEKTKLAAMVAKAEAPIIEKSKENSFSLYISVPFCPTRCSYCSFVSHSDISAK